MTIYKNRANELSKVMMNISGVKALPLESKKYLQSFLVSTLECHMEAVYQETVFAVYESIKTKHESFIKSLNHESICKMAQRKPLKPLSCMTPQTKTS